MMWLMSRGFQWKTVVNYHLITRFALASPSHVAFADTNCGYLIDYGRGHLFLRGKKLFYSFSGGTSEPLKMVPFTHCIWWGWGDLPCFARI
jgi:hypothetical protein